MLSLNTKELLILQMAVDGKYYKQMAPEVAPTEGTVKSKAWKLQAKLGAKTMTQAVAIAMRRGLIG